MEVGALKERKGHKELEKVERKTDDSEEWKSTLMDAAHAIGALPPKRGEGFITHRAEWDRSQEFSDARSSAKEDGDGRLGSCQEWARDAPTRPPPVGQSRP